MKKLFIILLGGLLLPLFAGAQEVRDARQRTLSTIIADALAQLPAQTPVQYNEMMEELAATGSVGIREMAGMLVPAAEGSNAPVEYALSGVVHYVTEHGREEARNAVRQGLAQSIAACTDNPNRAFLLSLLQLCSTAEDAPLFEAYAHDEYLADVAIRGLISTPGSEEILAGLIRNSERPDARLALAAAAKGVAAAEPTLLRWAGECDGETRNAVYHALGCCGSKASLRVLADAAAAADYDSGTSDAPEAYLRLLGRLAEMGQTKQVLAAAKSLTKAAIRTNMRIAALELQLRYDVGKRTRRMVQALEDPNRQYRGAALDFARDFADEELCATLAARIPSLDDEARTDLVNWLGERHAAAQIGRITPLIGSSDDQLAAAAIRAAGRIGGQQALEALIAALDGPHAAEAEAALAAFNGSVNEGLMAALDRTPGIQVRALKLIAARRISAAAEKVFDRLDSDSGEVRNAAIEALAGICTMRDFDRLCALLDKASEKEVAHYQAALKNALAAQEPDVRYSRVAEHLKSAPEKTRYYPLLAFAGTRQAIDDLLAASDPEAAFQALLTVQNPAMVDVLYDLAQQNPRWTDAAIARYADFVATAEPGRQVEYYRKGLDLRPGAQVRNKLLRALAQTGSLPALNIAAAYLDDPATGESAAYAVKSIAARNPGMGGESVVDALEKARTIYAGLAKNDPDAGYAVDQIKGLLARYAAIPRFELPEDEAKEGFELLFDGLSLEKWTGNKTNYVPQEGTIYVTAQFGGSGNLYTVKEYGDFVLRFEFSFVREGVNNGIGIRTPMGVDAAYHGMEIQILDHDAPIYKNLRIYQQHGSVYGIIPAQKHVVFGELGTWNTEEIRAVGDRITVTVNGEVILDGNIRTACKGHNVAPDGSNKNPYTVDGRNHPGLFNKRGHIGLLGHGPGIRFRNIRIKEL